MTDDGLVSRTADEKQPKHSGNDAPRFLVKASTTDTIFFVSKLGKAAAVAAHLIPEASKMSQGIAYHKVSPLNDTDALAAVFSLPASKSSLGEETCVITITRFRYDQEESAHRIARTFLADFCVGESQRR
ncbi:MAG: hypothetical protein IPJ47_19310 [Anaerolineales bacterium]|nr:hypothetical protein [Anaerolineales bacterium]